MPSKHKGYPTISFRPSNWERCVLEQRAKLSGLYKKDFIARSCCYDQIVIVGTKENLQRIVDTAHELQIDMKEIVGQLQSGDFCVYKDDYEEMKRDFLAFAITLVDILDGAAYLFDKIPPKERRNWKMQLQREQLGKALRIGRENEDKESDKRMDKSEGK